MTGSLRVSCGSGAAFAVIFGAVALVGCDNGRGVPPVLTTTNVVTVTRTVSVTNVVTAVVTNVATECRRLSPRQTSPFLVSSTVLDASRLREFLTKSGARTIECQNGAVALVEASDRTIASLGSVVSVKPLSPGDKIAPDVGECVRVVPVSSIDVGLVAGAVRELGGEVVEEVSEGRPSVRAKISYSAVRRLAARGDVRSIERDDK